MLYNVYRLFSMLQQNYVNKMRSYSWGTVGQSENSLTPSRTAISSSTFSVPNFPSNPSRFSTSQTVREKPHCGKIGFPFMNRKMSGRFMGNGRCLGGRMSGGEISGDVWEGGCLGGRSLNRKMSGGEVYGDEDSRGDQHHRRAFSFSDIGGRW